MEQIVNGLKYDTEKAARVQGGTGANQYTVPRGNNFPLPKTAEKIGEQFNVSDRTVKNAPEWSGPEWVTARISRSRWEADHAWQEKNRRGTADSQRSSPGGSGNSPRPCRRFMRQDRDSLCHPALRPEGDAQKIGCYRADLDPRAAPLIRPSGRFRTPGIT